MWTKSAVFICVRIVATEGRCLHNACQSACTARLKPEERRWILLLGAIKGYFKKNIWLESGKNIGDFTWSPRHVSLLLATLHRHKSVLYDWNGIRLLVPPLVCPSVRNYRRCSRWTDLSEMWYCGLTWKYVHKSEIWLKFGKNIGNFIWRRKYLFLLSTILNETLSGCLDSRGGINIRRTRQKLRYTHIVYLLSVKPGGKYKNR